MQVEFLHTDTAVGGCDLKLSEKKYSFKSKNTFWLQIFFPQKTTESLKHLHKYMKQ